MRAKDNLNNWGGWSTVWSFTIDTQGPPVPNLISPANGSTTNDNTPTFDWSDITDVVEYQIQVDNNSNFSSPERNQVGLTTSTYTPTSSLSDGTYYWRVRARDVADNWSNWSEIWNVTIDTQRPPAPTLISPANGLVNDDNTPTFDWNDVSGAVEYQLQVDDNNDFASPVVDQTGLTVSTYALAFPLDDGVYYWRVRAKDAAGNWSNWSAVWSFTIGRLKWRYQTGDEVHSSPAIGADGTIYVGSKKNYLYALNPDGSLKWSYQTGASVDSSPAIGADGTIYVGSDDGYLYALNPDGSLKWRYQTGSWVHSSPAIGADGTIYVGSKKNYLYALNPDGSLKWSYQTGASVDSSPAIGADGTIYVGSDDGYLYALNPDGSLKWRYQISDWVWSSPAIGADGTIYVGSGNGYLYALNPDGSLKWGGQTGSLVFSSPAIGADGTIYVGSGNGYLYALNPDGSLKWGYQTGDWVFSSPAIGADGTIYVGSKKNYLYALRSSSPGLANSPWPKFHHDNRNTGRVGGP